MHLSKSEWSTMSSILMVYAKHMYDSIRLKQFEIDKPPSTKQHVVFEKASLWLACCHVVFLSLYLAVAAKQHQQAIATYAYSSGKLAHTHAPASSQPSTRGGGGINYLAWGGGGGALLQSPSIKASSCGRTEGERKFRVSRGSWASIGLRLSSSPYRAVSSVCRHPYWIFFSFLFKSKITIPPGYVYGGRIWRIGVPVTCRSRTQQLLTYRCFRGDGEWTSPA